MICLLSGLLFGVLFAVLSRHSRAPQPRFVRAKTCIFGTFESLFFVTGGELFCYQNHDFLLLGGAYFCDSGRHFLLLGEHFFCYSEGHFFVTGRVSPLLLAGHLQEIHAEHRTPTRWCTPKRWVTYPKSGAAWCKPRCLAPSLVRESLSARALVLHSSPPGRHMLHSPPSGKSPDGGPLPVLNSDAPTISQQPRPLTLPRSPLPPPFGLFL